MRDKLPATQGSLRMNSDVERLYARLPHAGAMRLIEEVLDWGPDSVRCRSQNHRDPANPLRTAGGLRAVCSIEYAAQAAALHAILLADDHAPADVPAGKKSRALLALVNGLELETAYLDDAEGDLIVEGHVDYQSGDAVIYRFEVYGGTRAIARGRLGLTA